MRKQDFGLAIEAHFSRPVVLLESLCVPEQLEPRSQADKRPSAAWHLDLKESRQAIHIVTAVVSRSACQTHNSSAAVVPLFVACCPLQTSLRSMITHDTNTQRLAW